MEIRAADAYTERAYTVEISALLDALGIDYTVESSVRVKRYDLPDTEATPLFMDRQWGEPDCAGRKKPGRIQITVREASPGAAGV